MSIREVRKHAGMTQRELADALGCRTSHVSMLETGRRALSPALADRLATFTNQLENGLVERKTPAHENAHYVKLSGAAATPLPRRASGLHVEIVSTDEGELYHVVGRGETRATYSVRAAKALVLERLTAAEYRELELRPRRDAFDAVALHTYDSMRGWNSGADTDTSDELPGERRLELVPMQHGGHTIRREIDRDTAVAVVA